MINIPQVNAASSDPEQITRVINQLQQNIIDGVMKIQSSLPPVTSAIGDIQVSALSLQQFQQQRGTGWIAANGQGCSGSKYQKLTGEGVVPNITADPDTNVYIRVN